MNPRDHLLNQFRKISEFQGLEPDELDRIFLSGSTITLHKNEVVFHEDDPAAGLYILLEGQVQLWKLSPQGQIAILAVFEPTMMFNEVSALDGGPNPVTVTASEDSLVWRLAPKRLEALLLEYPRLAVAMLRILAGRNRRLVGHFQNLSFRTVMARTAKLLLELSGNGAQPIDRRKHTNHQLAARIATVPEAFSRSLKVLKESGEIECTHKQIKILQTERLLDLIHSG
jgi:CRP/FNR family transcriptional regulator, dissimilatory nitrate respiration regulator